MSQVEWLEAIGMKLEEVPKKIILEGTWWHKTRYPVRLAYLEKVRELKFPDMYLGSFEGERVMFCCAYGASRAVEPVHIFAILGSTKVIQIGSCGSLQENVQTGDVVIPTISIIGEGASRYYGQEEKATSTNSLAMDAKVAFSKLGIKAHLGSHISTSSLLQQSDEMIHDWRNRNLLGVDMETSAVFSAAEKFRMERVSMLFVWDELLKGRTWLHEFTETEKARQDFANQAIYEVALKL